MKTQFLGKSNLSVSRLAYGCGRIVGALDRSNIHSDAVSRAVRIIEAAFDAGYTVFDHADLYGDTLCESIFGQVLEQHPGWRDQMVIVTKCGIIAPNDPVPGAPHRYDFSYSHIIRSVEGSLRRLRIETIDLLLLHRPDFLADPAEIARAFAELRAAGKVREFGVSNFRPSLVSLVQSVLDRPLLVNQVPIHPMHLDAMTDGTLDQCLERQMTPMAWAPLAAGLVAAGAVPDPTAANRDYLINLLAVLDEVASDFQVDRTVIVLAWLLRHPSNIVPVVGTCNPEHICNAARATEVEMERETWYRILRAAREEPLP